MTCNKHDTITCTPGVQGGYPCIAGTRTPVRTIVELFYEIYPGDIDEVQRSLPHLTHEQIRAALEYYETCPDLVDEDIRRQREAIREILTVKVPRAS